MSDPRAHGLIALVCLLSSCASMGLPRASSDADTPILLQTNKPCAFSIDGRHLAAGRRLRVLVSNRPHTVRCKPTNYVAKMEYINPPYDDQVAIGFAFMVGDEEGANASPATVTPPVVRAPPPPAFEPRKAAPKHRPIVAVFAIQDLSGTLSPKSQRQLSAVFASSVAAQGRLRVLPEEQVRGRLRSSKKDSYRDCYDKSCQIAVGRELAAEKTVATKLIRVGNTCVLTAVVYDLKTAVSEGGAEERGPCTEQRLLEALARLSNRLSP